MSYVTIETSNKYHFIWNISGATAIENNPDNDNGDHILYSENVCSWKVMEDHVEANDEKWDNALFFCE